MKLLLKVYFVLLLLSFSQMRKKLKKTTNLKNSIDYIRKNSYGLERLNNFLDSCKNAPGTNCGAGWVNVEAAFQDRFPHASFGLSPSPSLDNQDDRRVCCLYLEMKENYDNNINNGKTHFLHSRTWKYVKHGKNDPEFTLTNITDTILQKTDRHWGLMSAIFAYIIRTSEKSAVVYVPNNGKAGCFSTLFMTELNMLRLPVNEEKRNSEERRVFNKSVEKYKEQQKKLQKTKNPISTIDNPEITSFPIEVRRVTENTNYTSEDNQFDTTLTAEFHDAETLYQRCAEVRKNNELEDDEYRRFRNN